MSDPANPSQANPSNSISLEKVHQIIGKITFGYEVQISQLEQLLQQAQTREMQLQSKVPQNT